MKQYDLKPVKDATKDFDRCSYDNVYCCYVNGNKEIRAMYFDKLSALPRQDALKYFEILKESVKGTVNKNTFAAGFSKDAEGENGTKEVLRFMVREGISRDIFAEFVRRLMDSVAMENETNYLITVFDNTIDIRPRGTDRLAIDDASEFSFHYLVASVCPAKLSDPGLSYDEEEMIFRTRITDWVAGKPVVALLYPTPAGDYADLDHAVVFSKAKEPEEAEDFIRSFTGIEEVPVASRKAFEQLKEVISQTVNIEQRPEVLDILDERLDMYRENHEDDEDAVITKEKLRGMVEEAGIPKEELAGFDETFEKTVENAGIPVYAIKELKPELKKTNVVIKAKDASVIRRREIDGEEYLLVPLSEGVKLNSEVL